MQLKRVLCGLVFSATFMAVTSIKVPAADAPAETMPVAAPEAAAEPDPAAPQEALPSADEGIPADSGTAAEDADTVVEGEEPKK